MLSEPLISPTGKSLLSSPGAATTSIKNLKSSIHTCNESFKVRKFFLKSGIVAACLNKDNSKIFAVTKANSLIRLNPTTIEIEKTLKLDKFILTAIAVSPEQTLITAGTSTGKILVIDSSTFSLSFILELGTIPIKSIAINNSIKATVLENDGSILDITLKSAEKRPNVTVGGRKFLLSRRDGCYFTGGESEIRLHESLHISLKIYEGRDKVLSVFHTKNYLLALLETNVCEIFDIETMCIVDDIYIVEKATVLTMTRDEMILIVADQTGKITFYDREFPQRFIQLQMSSRPIHFLYVLDDKREVLTLSNEIRCSKVMIPTFKKYEIFKAYTPYMLFISNTEIAYREKGMIFVYNHETKQSKPLLRTRGLSPCFNFIQPSHLVTSTKHNLLFLNTKTNILTQFKSEKVLFTKCIIVSPAATSLALSTNDRTVVVFNLKLFEFMPEFQGHSVEIADIKYCDENTLVSAAGPTLMIWDLTSGEQQGCEEQLDYAIEELLVHNEYLYTATENSLIFIWNWRLRLVVFQLSTSHSTKITKLWSGNEVLLSASSELIVCWDMITNVKVFEMETLVKNESLDISPDRSLIAYSTGSSIIFVHNPYASNRVWFLGGPDNKFPEFLQNLDRLYRLSKVEHNPKYTHWIIMPYRMNLGHIYAQLNMDENLRQFLACGGAVTNNYNGQNILSYTVDKNLDSCTVLIIAELKRRLISNPFSFSFITHEMLRSLNIIGSEMLSKLYELIYVPCTQSGVVKFCSANVRLPIYFHSNEFEITQKCFFEAVEDGVPIEFKQSLVKLSLVTGSVKSKEFIKSLMRCPYSDIFKTPFVQDILIEKWMKLRWVLYIQGIVYAMHIIVFGILLFDPEDAHLLFFLLFLLNLVLTIYEFFQVYVLVFDYFTDPWNWVDFLRLGSMNLFIILYWIDDSPSPHSLLYSYTNTFVTVLVFLRGVSYFRLFEQTRYMIDLIQQSVIDMLGFLLVLAFSVISFAFIFYTLEDPKTSLMQNIINSYSINIGSGEIRGGSLYSLLFYTATVINPIILLNLLISILGNSFQRVETSRVVSNYKELACLVLEVEQLVYWKVEDRASFLQSCWLPEEIEMPDQVFAKVKKVSVKLNDVQDMVLEIGDKVQEVLERVDEIGKSGEKVLKEVKELRLSKEDNEED